MLYLILLAAGVVPGLVTFLAIRFIRWSGRRSVLTWRTDETVREHDKTPG